MPTFTKTATGTTITTERELGAGGQGTVWKATDAGSDVAVKIYNKQSATPAQRGILERLVQIGPPAPQFLWPLAMVEDHGRGTFGYIMPLRPRQFHPFEDFLARRIEPTLLVLLTAAHRLVDAFLRLHSRGLCYRDISYANVFFDPKNGDVLICDNDNVDVAGAADGGVLGTPAFMAPEIVRGEATPNDMTDRYSLAVLLFYILMGDHPLDGALEKNIRCLDLPARTKLYGTHPVYIWDPMDTSNRPCPVVHSNPNIFYKLYPKKLLALFERAFTVGLRSPEQRVRESEWRIALAQVMDHLIVCRCGSQNFADGVTLVAGVSCWACRLPLAQPPRVDLNSRIVNLNIGSYIRGYHVEAVGDNDAAVGEVVSNPQRPQQMGIKNMTSRSWTFTRPDGTMSEVPPGRSVPIVTGNRINFGLVTGDIYA